LNAPAESIELLLDGKPHRVLAGSTLADLIQFLGHQPEAVSSAVDGQFVARAERARHVLSAGASVMLFKPIVGG
jgi:sulfur carrier protein